MVTVTGRGDNPIYTDTFPCFFFQFAPTLLFSNFINEDMGRILLAELQVKHAAEPGGTPCLGDTHESETCNEEAKQNVRAKGTFPEGKDWSRDLNRQS